MYLVGSSYEVYKASTERNRSIGERELVVAMLSFSVSNFILLAVDLRTINSTFWLHFCSNDGTFRAPEPLPRLNPSNFVPKNGFPVVKGLTQSRCDFNTFFFRLTFVCPKDGAP